MNRYLVLALSCLFAISSVAAELIYVDNQAEFTALVLNSPRPVAVIFSGNGCPPCQRFAPIVDEIARELDGKIRFVKVVTDNAYELSRAYKVRSIPTVLYFTGGQKIKEEKGFQSAAAFRSSLRATFGI